MYDTFYLDRLNAKSGECKCAGGNTRHTRRTEKGCGKLTGYLNTKQLILGASIGSIAPKNSGTEYFGEPKQSPASLDAAANCPTHLSVPNLIDVYYDNPATS